MKSLKRFIKEQAEESDGKAEKTIKNEDDFREAAEAKFEAVFGDDLDEDEMNKVIDGLIEDNPELVEDNEWGKLIGMLNASFAK